jgi:Flp pilus assembly protein TadG
MTLARLARRLRGHAGAEHGAVLVIVAGCMVLFLSLGAYTIDLGSGRQAEAKAQSAADAAALAVSDAASSGTTSTAALTTVAQTMLGANDDAGQTVQAVTKVSPGVYQVIVSGNSSGTLASAIGKTSPRVSAAAIAAAAGPAAVPGVDVWRSSPDRPAAAVTRSRSAAGPSPAASGATARSTSAAAARRSRRSPTRTVAR